MGFYVNVVAKKDCSDQINEMWNSLFGGFLINTPKSIKKEIEFIKNDPKQKHLLYLNSVEMWNKTFSIMAEERGQLFIRAFGYDDDESAEFAEQNQILKDKMKFILDNRLLFSKITNIQDAVDTLELDIKGDYIENGKTCYHEEISFENLPKKYNNPVYKNCLELNRPDIWSSFLEYQKDESKWSELRNKIISKDSFSTIWQRCEKIASVRDGQDFGYVGRYNEINIPPYLDVIKSISFDEQKFNDYICSFKR